MLLLPTTEEPWTDTDAPSAYDTTEAPYTEEVTFADETCEIFEADDDSPCGHAACGECLVRWLATKRECPECRAAEPPPAAVVEIEHATPPSPR